MKPAVEKVKVYLVDSQRLSREVATLGLCRYQDIEVAGGSDFSEDIQILIDVYSPEVVLLSVDDDFQQGLDLGHQITTGCPVAEIVALTSETNGTQLYQAFKSRMATYVAQDMSVEELGGIIRRVAQGTPLSWESVLSRPLVTESSLTKQIADIFKLSEQENINHSIASLQKTDAKDCSHVFILAIRLGWLSLEGQVDKTANN